MQNSLKSWVIRLGLFVLSGLIVHYFSQTPPIKPKPPTPAPHVSPKEPTIIHGVNGLTVHFSD